MSRIFKILLLSVIVGWGLPLWAQQNSNTTQVNTGAGGNYDLGAKFGSFLPYDINGVRELLPIWGVRFGHVVGDTLRMEYDLDMAKAKGVTFYSAYAGIRHDFVITDVIPLFLTFGFDIHHFKRKNTLITSTSFPFRTMTGWHLGFGGETRLFGSIYGRGDIRMGFSPGRQMTLTFGAAVRF